MGQPKVYHDIEKRRFVRLRVDMPAEATLSGKNLPGGILQVGPTVCRDVSRGGMCLEIPLRMEASWNHVEDRENIFDISVNLSDQLQISSKGRVAWSQRTPQIETDGVCGIVGIAFTVLDDKDRDAIIQHLVDKFVAGYPDQKGKGIWTGMK